MDLDDIVWEFDAELRAGRQPRMDDYLRKLPPGSPQEVELFLNLVRCELTHRGDGRPRTIEEYLSAFPRFQDVLELVSLLMIRQRFDKQAPPVCGGLGQVYRAFDNDLKREVALKELPPERADDPDSRRRFLNEAQITSYLEHPSVVPVHALGTDEEGRPYYVMKYVNGPTLEERITAYHARPGLAELRDLLRRFVTVCQTIAFAHSKQVIHRDPTPDNIVLGEYGETLVLDWGLAKRLDQAGPGPPAGPAPGAAGGAAGEKTMMVGKVHYLPPEQADGREVGPRADVYTLGSTLFHLLCGQRPFDREPSAEAVLEKKRRRESPRMPREALRQVPRALRAVCRRAMAPRPEDRYASALDLAAEVQRWLDDEPVQAYREPWTRRCQRWSRKHPTALAAGGVALVLTLVGAASGRWLWSSQQEAALKYLTTAVTIAEAEEARAQAEMAAGHFDKSRDYLQSALNRLPSPSGGLFPNHPALEDLRRRLRDRLELVVRLGRFYQLAAQAEGLAADQVDATLAAADRSADQDGQAIQTSERALDGLGVFQHADWMEQFVTPSHEGSAARTGGTDFSRPQREQLREDVYRQLILLATLRAKGAGEAGPLPPARTAAIRQTLAKARAIHPRSLPADLLELYCLSEAESAGSRGPTPAWQPRQVLDHLFLGILTLWVATHPDDAVARRVREHPGAVVGVNWHQPLAAAEWCFQTAIKQDPQHYWARLWLGITLKTAGNLSGATHAFGACIGLRSDCACAYAHLAYTVLQQAQREADPDKRDVLTTEGIQHLEKAMTLDPSNRRALQVLGDIYYRRGVAHVRAGAYDQAGEDLRRTAWLDLAHAAAPAGPASLSNRQVLFRDALERLQNDNWIGYRNACADLVNALEPPPDPQTAEAAAWLCVVGPGAITPADRSDRGTGSRGLSPFDWVRRWADRNGDGSPRPAHHRTILAAALYRKGRFAEALRELQEVVAKDPSGGTALDGLLLALTHRRLGQVREAQTWLDRALSCRPAPLPSGAPRSLTSPAWNERLACSLLLREIAAELKEAEARATLGAVLATRGLLEAAVVTSLAAGTEVGRPADPGQRGRRD